MNSDLLIQRKQAFHYNQEQRQLLTNLCEPLYTYLDVDWFFRGYISMNSQDEAVGYSPLVTDMEFLNLYMQRFDGDVAGKPFVKAVKETALNAYSYFLWTNESDCSLIQMCLQKIGIVKGLTIYKRCAARIEAWWFASKNGRGIPNTITQSSIIPFQDFIQYFDEKQIFCDLQGPLVNYPYCFDLSYDQPNISKIEDFKKSISANKSTLSIGDKLVSLSKREWECLTGFSQGKTYKGVANALSLSPRTVEGYLNQIKEKTGISHKSKLVDCFLENNQISF